MGSVVFTDGISSVALAPAGPPALGFPTGIEVESGPLSASIEAEAWNYTGFLEALRRLHESLVGEAKLTFVEGGHSVTLTGNGRGGVDARIMVGDGQSPSNAVLTIAMTLDQSYLHDIIDTASVAWLRMVARRQTTPSAAGSTPRRSTRSRRPS